MKKSPVRTDDSRRDFSGGEMGNDRLPDPFDSIEK